MRTGEQLIQGWRQNSYNLNEYLEACKQVGKSEALRKYEPIWDYITRTYTYYRQLCYMLGITPLNIGAWLRSEVN